MSKEKVKQREPLFKPAQCSDNRHVWDTDKKGRIVGDKCRCGAKKLKKLE